MELLLKHGASIQAVTEVRSDLFSFVFVFPTKFIVPVSINAWIFLKDHVPTESIIIFDEALANNETEQ